MIEPDEPHHQLGKVTLRRLEAFSVVYRYGDISEAGKLLKQTPRAVGQLLRDLELALGSSLFRKTSEGLLLPTAFGERFYNDLRFLTEAVQRLEEKIEMIRVSDRMLRIGTSPLVFRTPIFSRIFREIRALADMRISYIPIESLEAKNALTTGRCDWYVGCRNDMGTRFVNETIAVVDFRCYSRSENPDPGRPASQLIVMVDGNLPPVPTRGRNAWQPIAEETWLRWLERPEESNPGCVVCAPAVSVETDHWHLSDIAPPAEAHLDLTASYVRQHPYDFLPALAGRLSSRFLTV